MEAATQDAVTARSSSSSSRRPARSSKVSCASCARSTPSWRASRPNASSIACCRTRAARSRSSAQVGGAELFWGDARRDEERRAPPPRARAASSVFQKRVGEIEARAAHCSKKSTQQQEHAYFLEDDVFEALDEEEQRKHEWIVEREIDAIRACAAAKPWTRAARTTGASASPLATLAAREPAVRADRSADRAAPDATLEETGRGAGARRDHDDGARIRCRRRPWSSKPHRRSRSREQKPVEKPVAAEGREALRNRSRSPRSRDRSREFSRSARSSRHCKEAPILARLGAQARINNSDESSLSRPERSMLTTNAPGSSGGIKLAALSRDFGPTAAASAARSGRRVDARDEQRSARSAAADRPSQRRCRASRAPTRRSRSCSIATRRRSIASTTGSCATIRPCRARWSCA